MKKVLYLGPSVTAYMDHSVQRTKKCWPNFEVGVGVGGSLKGLSFLSFLTPFSIESTSTLNGKKLLPLEPFFTFTVNALSGKAL